MVLGTIESKHLDPNSMPPNSLALRPHGSVPTIVIVEAPYSLDVPMGGGQLPAG